MILKFCVHQNCVELSLISDSNDINGNEFMTENDSIASSKVNWLHGNFPSFFLFFCPFYLSGQWGANTPIHTRTHAHMSLFISKISFIKSSNTLSVLLKFCYDLACVFFSLQWHRMGLAFGLYIVCFSHSLPHRLPLGVPFGVWFSLSLFIHFSHAHTHSMWLPQVCAIWKCTSAFCRLFECNIWSGE